MSNFTTFIRILGIEPKHVPGYLIGFSFLILSAIFSADIAPDANVTLTLALAGLAGTVGWILGMAASPQGSREEALFGRAFGAVATLVGGFTAGKYMDALERLPQDLTDWPSYVWGRIVLSLLWFSIGILCTMPPRLAHISKAAEKRTVDVPQGPGTPPP